ncbi:MAG: DNA gyrase inhibitor YacG [Rhodobacterales bacterium]|nr:DNA gyrase inhibitor YacG [Rhodobacterales bacterium]
MPCPICEKDSHAKYRPFCSKHCADVDLGKWLNGSYSFVSHDPDDLDIDEASLEQESHPVH